MNELERWSDDGGAEFAESQNQGFDIIGMVKRRKWWMIVLTILGLAGGYTYYTLAPPVYESFAQLIVIQRQPDVATLPQHMRQRGGEFTVSDKDLATQAELLVSFETLNRAIEDSKLSDLPTFRGDDNVLKTVVENVNVMVGGRENEDAAVVTLTYRSQSPDDSREVILGIVNAYSKQLASSFEREGTELLTNINDARGKLQKDIDTLYIQYQEKKMQNDTVNLMRETGNAGILTLSETKVMNLEKQIAELETSQVITKVHRDELAAALQAEGGLDARAAYQIIQQKTKLSMAMEKADEQRVELLVSLQAELQDMQVKFGPEHPRVKSIQNRIKSIEDTVTGVRKDDEDEAEEEDVKQLEAVSTYLKTLEYELGEQEATMQLLQELSASEKGKLQEIVNLQAELDKIRHDIEQKEELRDAIVRRINEMDLMNYGGMTAQIITRPQYGTQVAPKLFFALLMGGGLGFGLGFGMGFLMEKADKSFRSPEQIRRELGLPVIGHIPVIMSQDEIGEAAENLDPILCTYYLPRSRYAEAYRAVRTALYFSTQYRDHNVIQITGANKDDGKSTLAANLAICIAQSGKRVLLVDADFRRPTISKLFGLQNDVGLSSIIKGVAEVPDVTQRTPVENLSVMVSGPKPTNPAELLTSPRFKELIDMLREQYDFVIFDSPPLLAVTDASVIAARVDGVILGLQITKRGRPAAVEATDKLDAIGAKILGVVVNGIGWKRAYAYRYGGNFGAQSRFYQIGTESELDGQGYIYGESVESDVIDADRTRAEPAALAAPTSDHGRDS